jgi:hypothetical protein
MGEAKRRKFAIGDQPIEPDLHERMNVLARFLDEQFNGDLKRGERKIGFCMMVFKFGDEGRCNYISNADKLDMRVLLKEQLARIEGRIIAEGKA